MGVSRDVYRLLVGKPEGKRPLGRPRHRWGIILKWIFRKLDEGMDWIYLAQNRDRWRALRIPKMREISRLAENRLASQ